MSNVKSKKFKVFIAMSGGVDSSVAAALLKKRGYEVTGVYMKCWGGGPPLPRLRRADACASEQDAEDARRAAEILGIPFYIFDFEKEYKNKVVGYMINGYKKGITPNPDVMCNKEIKFGLFLKKALEMGTDYVATGHYVRLRRNSQYPISNIQLLKSRVAGQPKLEIRNWKLEIARDLNKDQSYFLWTLTQEQLKHCLFPIGDYLKSEVRKMARKFGLQNADKKDSQGICFLGKVKIKDFLKKYIPPKKGIVVDTKGEIVGEHDGAQFYTIGQRHGIKLGKRSTNNAEPYFVAEKDIKSNAILVAEGENNPALYKTEIEAANISWINGKPQNNQKVMMRVRYRQPLFSAILKTKNLKLKTIFERPQKFVVSGQSAVFYNKKGEMLGGGIIV